MEDPDPTFGATPPEPPPGAPTPEERNWATAAHIAPVVAIFLTVGALTWLAPLVIWLMKRGESAFVEEHAVEALNFQITIWILLLAWCAAGGVLVCVGIGVFMLFSAPLLFVVPVLVFGIVGAMRASRGEHYRYPYTLRLVS